MDRMIHYYNGDKKKAEQWYNKPHPFISHFYKLSPKEFVEKGMGEEVLRWLKLVIER